MAPPQTDPELRYVEPFELYRPVLGSLVGRVVASKSKIQVGQMVGFIGPWAEYAVRQADHLHPLLEGVDPEAALGVVGLNGLAAWVGLLRVAKIKEKDIVAINAAAGATGYVACKIAQLHGCEVIGSSYDPPCWLTV